MRPALPQHSWTMSTFEGTCAFRLMPYDDLAGGPSTATFAEVGQGQVLLTYTWTHPEDGPQHGVLLVGSPEDLDVAVTATLADSWHQKPGLMNLTGVVSGDTIELASQYAGDWGWQITLTGVGTDRPGMIMRNVVPESALDQLPADAPRVDAGPYDVMVARWSR